MSHHRKDRGWAHVLLPCDAIAMLQRAAAMPITASDPLLRIKAVERAIQQVKWMYPWHFRG
ncbi:bbp39 [Bordetella bronchiseptica 253]|uniref:Bbp39 n=2 Tax=Bordetella bronchiseptica 253 TaxID=568707 RepID=A0A0C6P1H8_BORBO|nr:bbp39 [Bordetella bronchiseptica 253]